MITKNDLKVLLQCVESTQKTGNVHPDAMVVVGVTYQNTKKAIESMDDGDLLILFSPKKNELPGESGEQSQPLPENEPEPKAKKGK